MLMIIPFVFMFALIGLLGLWFFEKVPHVLFFPLALIITFTIPISASIASEHTHSNISYTDETGHHTYKNIHGLSNRGNGVYWFTDSKGQDHVITTPDLDLDVE